MQVNAHVANRLATHNAELRSYFEYSNAGVEVVEEGLQEVTFGEYLIDRGVIDRYQLFRALQMQDRVPGVRLGEACAALGYISIGAVEKLYAQLASV
ncbi:MAG: hypothetical protein NT062_03185, partial [Proteobacteria bacterium]|nr:hypothetical protein [Pseudomonadota bacterium]